MRVGVELWDGSAARPGVCKAARTCAVLSIPACTLGVSNLCILQISTCASAVRSITTRFLIVITPQRDHPVGFFLATSPCLCRKASTALMRVGFLIGTAMVLTSVKITRNAPNLKRQENEADVATALTADTAARTTWVADSGALHHMYYNRNNFISLKKLPADARIKYQARRRIVGHGHALKKSQTTGRRIHCPLHTYLLCSPLSIGQPDSWIYLDFWKGSMQNLVWGPHDPWRETRKPLHG